VLQSGFRVLQTELSDSLSGLYGYTLVLPKSTLVCDFRSHLSAAYVKGNFHHSHIDWGNAFEHGVWDSLADYPLNPLRATEGPGRNPFG
ncbi:hypothetical protein J6590_104007, partial [Homalodisca vitripennis]